MLKVIKLDLTFKGGIPKTMNDFAMQTLASGKEKDIH